MFSHTMTPHYHSLQPTPGIAAEVLLELPDGSERAITLANTKVFKLS